MLFAQQQDSVKTLEKVTVGSQKKKQPFTAITPAQSLGRQTLQQLNAPCHVIPKEMMDKRQARPGTEDEWVWRVSATGKAIAVRAPVENWRKLE